MGRGSGSIRPHLAVLLLLTGGAGGAAPPYSGPVRPHAAAPGRGGERIAAALPAELSPCAGPLWRQGRPGGAGGLLLGRQVGRGGGWDARWGVPAVVTAPGSSTSGESLPFGLDCSGFVSWCAVNAAGDPAAFAAVGNGVRAQRALCAPVDWADALPGDLAFYPDLSHVGIVAGRGEDGGLLVLHCSLLPGGRGVLLRRQGRGLHRPGPPLIV